MFAYYLLSTISALIFFTGFFPIRNSSSKFNNEPPCDINGTSLRREEVYKSDIETTVIVVIDALRLDFVTSDLMRLTSKIAGMNGCINRLKVETPTVTLPRLKAMMAGNVPQFIDIVLNLVSKEVLSDSLIHSAYERGKYIIFYGDDTWLRLFPSHFSRFEGTSSFFVRDFTEVDDNVTRNVDIELSRTDWDVMVLHYLGLDHIGHVYGPFSSLVPLKLREMDEIINKIYRIMVKRNKPFLLVITGDHGMRDSGGHGGSTYAETNVPLVITGVRCINSTLAQTDVPANLAVLLGLNIPSTSIGQIRQSMLLFNLEKYLYVLRYNNILLKQKSSICDSQFDLATVFHETYLRSSEEDYGYTAIELYKNCSEMISEDLIKSSVNQNVIFLVVAILMMLNIIIILIVELFTEGKTDRIKLIILFVPLISFLVLVEGIFFVQIFLLFVLFVYNITLNLRQKFYIAKNLTNAFIFVSFIHPLTYFSSSFVEEEHQYWYFCNISFVFGCLIYFFKKKNRNLFFKCLILLSLLRFLRTINSTGDKWANYPDFADWLLKEEHFYYYQVFSMLGFCLLYFSQCIIAQKNFKLYFANLTILIVTFIFKNFDSNVFLGRVIWILILCHFVVFHRNHKVITWTLILALLLKPYNTVLIGYCILFSITFQKLLKSTENITFYHMWLGHMLYFAQGHSNSLASVDISIGYIGLTEYQPALVILQVLFHTYAFTVLSHVLVLRNPEVDKRKTWNIFFCCRLYNFSIICIVTFIQRHHLFIWSVFAPKLFIEFVHIVFLFVEYCCFVLLKFIS